MLYFSRKVACKWEISTNTTFESILHFLINYVYTITYTITIHLLVIYRTAPSIKKLTSVFLCRKECFASVSRPEP